MNTNLITRGYYFDTNFFYCEISLIRKIQPNFLIRNLLDTIFFNTKTQPENLKTIFSMRNFLIQKPEPNFRPGIFLILNFLIRNLRKLLSKFYISIIFRVKKLD